MQDKGVLIQDNIEVSGRTKDLGLEDIVQLTNKIGIEYATAKANLERFELMRPVKKAQISLRLDEDGGLSEVKLKRLTEADDEYVKFLDELHEVKLKCETLRIRYESYKNLFEAKRSVLSYQKAEMNLI